MSDIQIGIYLCECGGDISTTLDLDSLKSYLASFDDTTFVEKATVLCSNKGTTKIQKRLQETNIDRLVLGICSPKVYEKKFERICEETGFKPEYLQIANIREQCAFVHEGEKAQQKARKILRAAVERVKLHEPTPMQQYDIAPSTVIVGGGITGMKAALTIAESGRKVHLVEKTPSLGGKMKYLSKIFLGQLSMCSSNCILRQVIASVRNHPNIEVSLNSEIKDVKRPEANFDLSIEQKQGFVDEDRCIRCGKCEEVCPATREGMKKWAGSSRKAIYTPLPQEFEDTPAIDTGSCLYFTDSSCTECRDECPTDAISFTTTKETQNITAGSVLLTTGARLFDPEQVEAYGYGEFDNVITTPECELLSNPMGPTQGKIVTNEGKQPESIAILHCVGSRDPRYNEYCSNICCMYSLKVANILREKLPEAEIFELYIDMRTPSQGYEELYQDLQERGVRFIRGKGAEVQKREQDDKLVVRCEDTRLGVIRELPVDMVVLGVGITPKEENSILAEEFGLQRSDNGFYKSKHPKLSSVRTDIEGIFIAGDNEWPKDIPNALEQGDAAAAQILSYINHDEVKTVPIYLSIEEDSCSTCGLCVSVCPYSALTLDEDTVEVNDIQCQGCGSCVSTCPTGSLNLYNSTDKQIFTEIITLTNEENQTVT